MGSMLPKLAIALLAALTAAPPPRPVPPPRAQEQEIDAAVRSLRGGDRRERLAAIEALAAHGAAAVPALAEALSDRVAEVRWQAASALAGLGPVATPAAAELVEAGADDLEAVRREAWNALGRLGPRAAPALSAAATVLPPPRSLRPLLSLGRLDADAPEVLAAALPVLVRESATPGERAAALAAVVRAGPRAHPDLAEALVHPAATSRAAAAVALGLIGVDAPHVRGALAVAAGDADAEVRRRATWALGQLAPAAAAAGDPGLAELVAALERRLADESVEVRRAAVWGLGRAGAAGVPALLDVERSLWPHAVTALGRMPPADVEERLMALVESDDTPVERSLSALLVVQRWGPRAQHLSTRLAQLLDHSRTWTRIAALRALNWTGYDEPAVADLLELALQHEDPRIRGPAAAALGHARGRSDRTLQTMARMLREDPDPGVRQALAWVLGGFDQHPEQVVPALVAALDDPDPTVRHEAARSVEQIGPRAFPAASRLALALAPLPEGVAAPGDAELAEAARDALLAMGAEAKPALLEQVRAADRLELAGAAMSVLLASGTATQGELRELSRDGRVLVRVLATQGLIDGGLTPTKGLKTFIDGVKDRHDEARVAAARALAALGSTARTALNALTGALVSAPPAVRVELVAAIAAVAGDRRAGVQELIEVLEDDPAPEVRVAAAGWLGELGENARHATRALLGALEDPDPTLREAAAEALGGIAPDTRSATEALVARLARDDSPAARRAAARALGRLRGSEEHALAALRAALDDSSAAVACGAAHGLGALGEAATGEVTYLADHLLSDPRLELRVACAEALAELGPLAREATPALALAVLYEEETTRTDELLSASFDQAPLRPYDDGALSGPAWLDVRAAAARALGAIGPAAESALPALDRGTRSSDPRLSEACLLAIARVRP